MSFRHRGNILWLRVAYEGRTTPSLASPLYTEVMKTQTRWCEAATGRCGQVSDTSSSLIMSLHCRRRADEGDLRVPINDNSLVCAMMTVNYGNSLNTKEPFICFTQLVHGTKAFVANLCCKQTPASHLAAPRSGCSYW